MHYFVLRDRWGFFIIENFFYLCYTNLKENIINIFEKGQLHVQQILQKTALGMF